MVDAQHLGNPLEFFGRRLADLVGFKAYYVRWMQINFAGKAAQRHTPPLTGLAQVPSDRHGVCLRIFVFSSIHM
ncbi:hypothetical protein BCD48_39685 [Pseudofrankia sp. BMG5.36]|nr:hypothetical protein BCD48_39685 [Pseudofrankia sp. BMG5.36]